jgi:L-fuculose-phosphate aldolase
LNRFGIARGICRVGQKLAERGLIGGSEGNIGVRLGPGRLLVTPRGRAKGDLVPDDLIEVDLDGRPVRGGGQPSTELLMHLAIFQMRADVQAVVHAHPPTATGFATAGLSVNCDCIPELLATLGEVPLVPYGMSGTPELSEQMRPYIMANDALLLANHGCVTMGVTLEQAHQRMESVEQAAKILFTARMLGGPVRLDETEVARLEAAREATRRRSP